MKNKIEDLRDHLFATIEALRDEEKPMDLERAKTISTVAQTIINSAQVEVAAARAMGAPSLNTGFIPATPRGPKPLELPSSTRPGAAGSN